MDILDIMIAKAMTPQGKTDAYVAKANAAAAKAAKAEQDAAAAIATVDAAASDIADKKTEAAELLAAAQEALETAQEAQINTLDIDDIDDEIDRLALELTSTNSSDAIASTLKMTTPSGEIKNVENIVKLYKSTGTNEDGTMTQKAITDALDEKASTAYVNQAIAAIPHTSGGGVSNLGSDTAGHLVKVGEDGNITAADVTESQLIETLMRAGAYEAKDALGLQIDYEAKAFQRTQQADTADFNSFSMYGGRMRCNVSDNGNITAFYGDANYKDDGSNGQVMVYQPKFYYQRIPLKVQSGANGKIVRSESIIVSPTAQSGFKLHPIFKNNDEELDYVLLPAYEGSLQGNKLASIGGVKPASNMTVAQAEAYAVARGTGWHITNMAAESATQMLSIVELGTMNGQDAIESGISDITNVNGVNCASYTGSTAALGNATGHAESSINEVNGTETEYDVAGKRAISYRGMENIWGNMWRFIGGLNIHGDGYAQGGKPYICKNFNYILDSIPSNYEYIGFNLPTTQGWISAMGYGSADYDWVLLPAECASTANSALPVGDSLWVTGNLAGYRIAGIGGSYSFKESNGLFYYACDRSSSDSARPNYGANLMFIPTKNSIYTANIQKWNSKIGG